LDGGYSRAWRYGAIQNQASISWLLVLHFCRSRTEDKGVSNRVKKCGSCGQLSSETELYCVPCEAQFTGQEPVTDEPQKASPSSMDVPAAKQACPICGTINETYSVLCSGLGCGRDLSVTPSMPTRLWLIAGENSYECRDGDILGREGTLALQLFAGIGTVSRRHVRFSRSDKGWSMTTQHGVQNITQLDGCELSQGTVKFLTGEHILKMSTQCEVTLKVSP